VGQKNVPSILTVTLLIFTDFCNFYIVLLTNRPKFSIHLYKKNTLHVCAHYLLKW